MLISSRHKHAHKDYSWLSESGYISPEDLEGVINLSGSLTDAEHSLVNDFGIGLNLIGASLAHSSRLSYLPFDNTSIILPEHLTQRMSRDMMNKWAWMPVGEENGCVIVVTHDQDVVKNPRHESVSPFAAYGRKIQWKITTHTEFAMFLDWMFGEPEIPGEVEGENLTEMIAMMTGDDNELTEDDQSATEDNEIVKLINRILVEAYHKNISDIHIDPLLRDPVKDSTLAIRFRLDGVLRKYAEVPFKYRSAIISRLKILAGLDISERRTPQDGKFKVNLSGASFEMRIVTIPTHSGMENAVIRILASGKEPLPIDGAGFSEQNAVMIKAAISKPYGLFFVCGPTGSGKTTTLHSMLAHLNTGESKIWTVEDPVEIVQEGLCQVPVDRKAGRDFPMIMRSFLRADPDIIMVGEMRDKETVAIGIEASLTGHLVLSTLHTNSAPESIIRLLDMGMDPFNFADALLGILAQRLVRRLCKSCMESYEPSQEEIAGLIDDYFQDMLDANCFTKDTVVHKEKLTSYWREIYGRDGRFVLNRASVTGCEVCDGRGYKGREGLHEFLIANNSVKEAIQSRKRPSEIAAIAFRTANFRTLRQDGIEKVVRGGLDIKEVKKVCVK